MWQIYYTIYLILLISFLSLLPLLFAIKIWTKQPPWSVITIIISIVGAMLVNGTIFCYYEYLSLYIKQHPNPPQYLVDRLTNDGAKRVFGVLFGWLYGPLYSVPWFQVYLVVVYVKQDR